MSGDQCKTHLYLGWSSGLNEEPSSIMHPRNVEKFCFPICESLEDLPEHFAVKDVFLSDSEENERDALITFGKIPLSSGFRNGIMDAIEERKAMNDESTTYNSMLTRKFYARNGDNEDLVIVINECGVHWIYEADQIVEQGDGCKSKRTREIYECNAILNGDKSNQSHECNTKEVEDLR
ncbi:hypothetical protein RIF29_26648 [Crotalaria pallida]|uniref:Uncharacterized protein n=1 Tax=Crotalaria pallida TaxID=3830 RepID=A0AAN9I0G9_CROPI